MMNDIHCEGKRETWGQENWENDPLLEVQT